MKIILRQIIVNSLVRICTLCTLRPQGGCTTSTWCTLWPAASCTDWPFTLKGIGRFRGHRSKLKELSSCHKLWCSNLYIFATMNSFESNNLSLKYHRFTPSGWKIWGFWGKSSKIFLEIPSVSINWIFVVTKNLSVCTLYTVQRLKKQNR